LEPSTDDKAHHEAYIIEKGIENTLIFATDELMDAHIKHHTTTSSLQEILGRP